MALKVSLVVTEAEYRAMFTNAGYTKNNVTYKIDNDTLKLTAGSTEYNKGEYNISIADKNLLDKSTDSYVSSVNGESGSVSFDFVKDASVSGNVLTITKSDNSELTFTDNDHNDNQKVKTSSVTFGANDTVEIKAGNNITVAGDASAKTITITGTDNNDNQTVKADNKTFGANDVVEIVGGTNVSVSANTTNKTITLSATDTTYSFAEGSTNGAISVTPSGGSAQSVPVHGLGAAAYKGVATSIDEYSTDNNLATAKAVYDIFSGVEPVQFKGTLGVDGTIETLPAASVENKGYLYKVITAGTYQGLECNVNDTVISDGTEWTLIPSGDEPSGTVTSVNLTPASGSHLTVSGDAITSSGTFTLGVASGYSIPSTTDQTAWNAKYDKPSGGIPASDLASGVIPTELKNPNKLNIKANSDANPFIEYDGSVAKTLTVKASSDAGAFELSDGTTTKKVQLAGSFTDNNDNQTVKTGNVTFGANDVVSFVGTGRTTITGDASAKTITINTTGDGNDNQKVKAGSVTFDANDVVNFVGTGAATVTGNASDDSITINVPVVTDTNQKIKVGSTTFGNDAVIDIVAGTNVSVNPATSGTGSPKITISSTDTNQKVKAGSTTFDADDVVNFVGGGIVSVTGDTSTDTITVSASHQSIKTLKTDNTSAQSTSASEAIAGSGTINLHKIAKTGSYSDLNNKPTLDDISDGSTRKLSDYLPLNGGSMTGDITLANTVGLKSKDSGGTARNLLYVSSADNIILGDEGITGQIRARNHIIPSDNVTSSATIGTSTKPWLAIYGTTIYENGTSLTNKYLGKTAKAADSDKLDGHDSTYFQAALPTTTTAGKVLKSTSTAGTVQWQDDASQTVKGNGTAFGANDAVDIVGTGATTVTADTTNKKITINTPVVTDTNQKIKVGSTTFGNDDVIDIVAGTNVSIDPATTGTGAPKITITSTDTNQKITAKNNGSNVDFGNNATVELVAGSNVSVTPNTTNKTITIASTDQYQGTVTSVRVQATSPVQSSTSSAQSTSLNTTISLADAYGDTKNPYGSKTANTVLAAPNGSAGAPGFRALVKADLPSLTASDVGAVASVKTLDTTATSAQTTSSSEAISGTGSIKLHKVSKTGSYNDLNNKPTIPAAPNDGTLTMQVEGSTKATFTANQSGNSTFNVTASDLGLSSAMKFIGTTTSALSDGSTTNPVTIGGNNVTATSGNVVLYGNKEFVWTGSAWEELGDGSSFALKTTTITGTGVLSGGGAIDQNRTITHNEVLGTAQTTAKVFKVKIDKYGHISEATAATPSDIGAVAANAAITGATKCKITYDSKGLVTAGDNLSASDIPNLAASKITSGTFPDERIANASTWNAKYDKPSTGIPASDLADGVIPTALKNPNALGIKVNSESSAFTSYDGSAAKTITIKPSSTAGAFTIGDGTTTKTIQLAGNYTDYNDNQTIKGNGVAFGANDVIDIVGSGRTTVTGNATNKTITISSTGDGNDNQTVKVGSSTFGANDAVGFVGGTNVTVSADTSAKTITIASTDTNQKVKTGNVTFGANDVVEFVNGTNVSITGNATNKTISIAATDTNQKITAKSGSSNVSFGADDTIEIKAGTNVSVTPSTTNKTITIGATDTTYTIDTGDSNGQIKVTPSSGSAYNVTVKGINNAAYKDVTSSVTSGSTDLVTSGAVYTAIDNLPEPMVFKGTLGTGGTITSLPSAATGNEGYTYKVITAGTYQSIAAKVGDVFVSNGSSWVLIPSGDDVEDTWRGISIDGDALLGNAISTGDVNFVPGTGISITGSGNDITITNSAPDTNQKVKVGSTTFGSNDTVNFATSDSDYLSVSGDSDADTITLGLGSKAAKTDVANVFSKQQTIKTTATGTPLVLNHTVSSSSDTYLEFQQNNTEIGWFKATQGEKPSWFDGSSTYTFAFKNIDNNFTVRQDLYSASGDDTPLALHSNSTDDATYIAFYTGSTWNGSMCLKNDGKPGMYTKGYSGSNSYGLLPISPESMYNLGDYDTVVDNNDGTATITRKTGYIDLNKLNWIYQGPDYPNVWRANYETGLSFVNGQVARDDIICNNYASTKMSSVPSTTNSICINSDWWTASTEHIIINNGSSTQAPTGIVEYELSSGQTYTEKVIKNQSINTLDLQGSNYVREVWEDGLNIFDINAPEVFDDYGNHGKILSFKEPGIYHINCETSSLGTLEILKWTNYVPGTAPDAERAGGYNNQVTSFTFVVSESDLSKTLALFVADSNNAFYFNGWFPPFNIMINKGDHVYTYKPYNGDVARQFESEKSLYNLGHYDVKIGNKILRKTGYLNLSKFVLEHQDDGYFRNSASGCYEYGPLGIDVRFINCADDHYSRPVMIANNNFIALTPDQAWNNSSAYGFSSNWISLPNSYSSKAAYLQYFASYEVIVEYELPYTSVEEIIKNESVSSLDRNGEDWLREEYEKSLNLNNGFSFVSGAIGQWTNLALFPSTGFVFKANTPYTISFRCANFVNNGLYLNEYVFENKILRADGAADTTYFVLAAGSGKNCTYIDGVLTRTIITTQTITASASDVFIKNSTQGSTNFYAKDLMIVEGKIAYPYHPYNGGIARLGADNKFVGENYFGNIVTIHSDYDGVTPLRLQSKYSEMCNISFNNDGGAIAYLSGHSDGRLYSFHDGAYKKLAEVPEVVLNYNDKGNVDLDNLVTTGMYRVNTPSHKPAYNSNSFSQVIVSATSDTFVQFYCSYDNNRIFTRTGTHNGSAITYYGGNDHATEGAGWDRLANASEIPHLYKHEVRIRSKSQDGTYNSEYWYGYITFYNNNSSAISKISSRGTPVTDGTAMRANIVNGATIQGYYGSSGRWFIGTVYDTDSQGYYLNGRQYIECLVVSWSSLSFKIQFDITTSDILSDTITQIF